MTDTKLQQLAAKILVEDYLAKGGKITRCPPAIAYGAKVDPLTARQIAAERREWQK